MPLPTQSLGQEVVDNTEAVMIDPNLYKGVIKKGIQAVFDSGEPCVLCGGKPHIVGVFIPRDAQHYGAQKGKVRFIFYPLCEACMNDPETTQKIELWAKPFAVSLV